jgi:CO/xanthine dehydrogenase FAD-binding subunit
VLPIEEFFSGRGENPFVLEPDELVGAISLETTPKDRGSSFQKLTYRAAIDFALVSAAARLTVEQGTITAARIAIGGAGAAPLLLKEAADALAGKAVDDVPAIADTARQVRKHASAFMVDNLGSTLAYRVKMSEVLAKRAVFEALAGIE